MEQELIKKSLPVQKESSRPEKDHLETGGQKGKENRFKETFLPAVIILAIIFAGVGTGYWLVSRKVGQTETSRKINGAELVQGEKEVGIKDEKVFKDSAEGKIEVNKGELVAEGSHKLIRPGGESQIAYLTSSVVNLDQFVGKCVEIWGETFAAQKAGWLMDVGRVKLLDSCPKGI